MSTVPAKRPARMSRQSSICCGLLIGSLVYSAATVIFTPNVPDLGVAVGIGMTWLCISTRPKK